MATPKQIPEFLKGNKTLLRTINDLYRNGLITNGLATTLRGRGLTRVSELIGLPQIEYKDNAVKKKVPFISITPSTPKTTKEKEISGEQAHELQRVLQNDLGLDLGLLEKHGLEIDTGSKETSYKHRIKPTLQKTCDAFCIPMPKPEYESTTPTEIDVQADKLIFKINLKEQFSFASKGLTEEKIIELKEQLDKPFQKAAKACKAKLVESVFERLFSQLDYELTDEDIEKAAIFRRDAALHIRTSGVLELRVPIITSVSAIFTDNHSALDVFIPDADTFYEEIAETLNKDL